ncbi:hypothetical protein OAN21_01590 [Alphaproteobacteria bacterium]|nr:hypothetical protein [Alphaproteobacteria bacterium]
MIQDIRVGTEIKKTRVEFVLSHPVPLYVRNQGEAITLVEAPEDTFWKIPNQKRVNRGAISKYELIDFEGRRSCRIMLEPYTSVVGSFLRKNSYILDLEIKETPPPPPPLPPEPAPEPPPPPSVNIKQTLETTKNEINSLVIIPKEDGTTWVIVNSDKRDFFEYQIMPDAQKLNLYLPKINWPSLETQVLNSGSVESYSVDESNPDSSVVMMALKKSSDIIDLFSTPNLDGTYDFVLILANRKASAEETKWLAEKRMQIKSIVSSKKEVSFKISPPDATFGPSLSQVKGFVESDSGTLEGQNIKKKKPHQEDPLFDPLQAKEESPEPEWVSDVRPKALKK